MRNGLGRRVVDLEQKRGARGFACLYTRPGESQEQAIERAIAEGHLSEQQRTGFVFVLDEADRGL